MESLERITYRPEASYSGEVTRMFNELIETPEIVEALTLLDTLPESLFYHVKEHTLDVIRETILFALVGGERRDVIQQQAISAAWHDVGFIEKLKDNEEIAVRLFEESACQKRVSENERKEIIANMLESAVIMKDGQPFFMKEKSTFGYFLDGDLSNFGREDFFEKRDLVAQELGVDLTNPEAKKKFYGFTLDLLRNHEWKTESARVLRQPQKEINIKKAEEEYALLR